MTATWPRGMLGDIAAAQDDSVLAGLVKAAQRDHLWADLLPVTPELLVLLALLPAASRRRVAPLGTGFGRSILPQIVRAAHEEGLWAPLVRCATELEQRTQREVAKIIGAVDDDLLDGLLDAIEEDDLQDEFVRLAARLGATEMRAFAKRLAHS